jgi:oligoendopeptidase F
MSLLPFGELPAFKPRKFVPARINWSEWKEIEPLFDALEKRATESRTLPQFEQWLLDGSELMAALDEESSRRYIAMTCHTDDAEAEKAYLHFVEHIEPQLKPRQFRLSEIYLKHPLRKQLSQQRYEVFDRDRQVHVDLFRQENVPLQTEEAKLGQQYQKLTGSLTVQFRGEEKTLVQMGRYLEEPDRAIRQEAWELVARRRLREVEKFEDIFEKLVKLREQIARNAGFKSYLEYAFKDMRRFDYTPADCLKFHDAIENEIMPLNRALQAKRRKELGLEKLRPWDLAVDPFNRPPLRPFEKVDDMVAKTQKIFERMDHDLAQGFNTMQTMRLLDLANRKGKAPGGYQSTLNEARLPFIFMNAVGVHRDVETILHEAGHAFHALATRNEDLYSYRSAPIEFCEVASMSMELLGDEFIEEFYAAKDANRARREHLEGIIKFFPWMATIDAFQIWIYQNPGHSPKERTAFWLKLMDRFGDDVDWAGYEDVRAHTWHRQLHVFLHPFYYVEYGIAQLGALQVWANSKKDKAKALNAYKRGLALGGSRPLPELFQAADCRLAFDANTIKPLVDLVNRELERVS